MDTKSEAKIAEEFSKKTLYIAKWLEKYTADQICCEKQKMLLE